MSDENKPKLGDKHVWQFIFCLGWWAFLLGFVLPTLLSSADTVLLATGLVLFGGSAYLTSRWLVYIAKEIY